MMMIRFDMIGYNVTDRQTDRYQRQDASTELIAQRRAIRMTCSSYNSEVSSVNMSHADLENMYNCSCEKALLNDSRSLRRQGKDHGHLYHLLQSSTAASGTHAQ